MLTASTNLVATLVAKSNPYESPLRCTTPYIPYTVFLKYNIRYLSNWMPYWTYGNCYLMTVNDLPA